MLEPPLKKIKTRYGTFHALDEDLITEQLITYSAHTRNELAMVLDHIGDNDVILDIGAHIGTYSIPMAQKAINGTVHSIEADNLSYNLLLKNIEENKLQERIIPHHFLAAGSPLNYSKGNEIENNSGANYYVLSETKTELMGTPIRPWLASLTETAFDFIKLDIEGMEYQVLSSIQDILEKQKPKLYIEVVENQLSRLGNNPKEIQSLLDGLGYKYYVNTYHRNSKEDRYTKTEIHDFAYSKFFDVLALPV